MAYVSTRKGNTVMAEGKLNPREQARLEENRQKRKTRAKYIAVSAVLLLMVLLVVFVNSSLFTDGLAALKVGDVGYSVADVNYEYRKSYMQLSQTYGDYISLFLDPDQPLSEQQCAFTSDGGTWDDYFKESAETALIENTAYSAAAREAGYELTDEERAQIDTYVSNYELYGSLYGYDVDAYIAANFGAGNNEKTLRRHMEQELINERYLSDLYDSFSFTDEEKDAYYIEHADTLDQVSYLYSYVAAEEGKDAGETAQAVLDGMEGSDEAAFRASALAVTGSEATRSSTSRTGFLSQYTDGLTAEEIREGAVFTHDSGSGWYAIYVLGTEDNSYHTVSVRHVLIKAEDTDGDGIWSDEEKAAAYDTVKALYDEWLAGEATEESFAALAVEHSQDEGSAENGGLYENVYKGQMVEEFDAFCFGGHQKGDTDIVYGESGSYAGYHIIYFVGEDADPYSRIMADSDLRGEAYNDAITALTDPLTSERTFMWRYVMKG